MPNMQTDPPCTWDDVITNRSIFFEFIQEKYLNSLTSSLKGSDTSSSFLGDYTNDNFDEDLLNISKKIKKKMTRTNFLMKINFAQAAQSQGNFKLTLNKLQQTRSILKIKNSDFHDLQLVWMHCYLNTHLYRCKQVNNADNRLMMFLDSMVLREILKYDTLCERFKNNQFNNLYQEQRVIHSKFCKFLIDLFIGIDSLNKDVLEEEKYILQLSEYIKTDKIENFNTVRFFSFF